MRQDIQPSERDQTKVRQGAAERVARPTQRGIVIDVLATRRSGLGVRAGGRVAIEKRGPESRGHVRWVAEIEAQQLQRQAAIQLPQIGFGL